MDDQQTIQEQQRQESIRQAIERGQAVGQMAETPGFRQYLEPWLRAQMNENRNLWLQAKTPQEAEIIRIRTGAYHEILKYIVSCILIGQEANTPKETN